MINPEDELLPDDSDGLDMEDQQSQQDIHAIGLDINPEDMKGDSASEADLLKQASDAAEASFTLKLDDAPPKTGDDKKK